MDALGSDRPLGLSVGPGRTNTGPTGPAMRKACSSLVERCLNMAEEGVRFLPRLSNSIGDGTPLRLSNRFFPLVGSADVVSTPFGSTQRLS
jgi:hypothetical protein